MTSKVAERLAALQKERQLLEDELKRVQLLRDELKQQVNQFQEPNTQCTLASENL